MNIDVSCDPRVRLCNRRAGMTANPLGPTRSVSEAQAQGNRGGRIPVRVDVPDMPGTARGDVARSRPIAWVRGTALRRKPGSGRSR